MTKYFDTFTGSSVADPLSVLRARARLDADLAKVAEDAKPEAERAEVFQTLYPRHPDDTFLAALGFVPIEEGSPPPTEQGEQVIEGAIEIINGIPTRTFTVERLPDDALARLVNRERDRRKFGGFDFTVRGTSYRFQSDPISLQNISGAVQMASLAIAAGATAGNLQWDGSGEDFGWTVEDNSVVALDPFEMIALGQFAAAHVARAHKRARQIKNITPVPTGFDADSYWS